MKSKFPPYNSGVLEIYNRKEIKSDFGAAKNITSKSDLVFIAKFPFTEMSKRDEDIEFAERQGSSLSMKVKIRFADLVKKSNDVVIGDKLYNIYKLDIDRAKQELYLYLEEVRKLER